MPARVAQARDSTAASHTFDLAAPGDPPATWFSVYWRADLGAGSRTAHDASSERVIAEKDTECNRRGRRTATGRKRPITVRRCSRGRVTSAVPRLPHLLRSAAGSLQVPPPPPTTGHPQPPPTTPQPPHSPSILPVANGSLHPQKSLLHTFPSLDVPPGSVSDPEWCLSCSPSAASPAPFCPPFQCRLCEVTDQCLQASVFNG